MSGCICLGGFTELSETLLKHGASTDLKNAAGKSALDIAIGAGSHGVTSALLQAGADVAPVQAARLLLSPYCYYAILVRAIGGDRTFAVVVVGVFACLAWTVARFRASSHTVKGRTPIVHGSKGTKGRKNK